MPWEERTVKQQREDFVKEVKAGVKTKSELCREYEISRVTGDKWIKRYENGEELEDRSHAPYKRPEKTPETTEKKILEIRRKHPVWGARKIGKILSNQGTKAPATSTISLILKRNGCISEEASAAATQYKRFEREKCNELWQTDFKGHFEMKDGNRCHPLTVLDDHSRYSLCVDAKENERKEGVIASFTRLFKTFGLPESLLCDNGNPWGASQSNGHTLFEIWLMNLGILPIHGRIKHPQTQGKEERFHRTMKAELLKQVEISDMLDAQVKFDAFRDCYNNERPHEAIDMNFPANIYQPSEHRLPEKIREWVYPEGFDLRKIKTTGYVTYSGQGYFLSEAFGGMTVGIRESRLDGCINLYYRQFRIGRINLKEKSFISKRIYPADPDSIGGEI